MLARHHHPNVYTEKVSLRGVSSTSCPASRTLKRSSYRLKDTGIDTLPSARADNTAQ